jgi:hypothetical protein
MSLTIVTRQAAGLPTVPSTIGHRTLASWTGIRVHHTGGAFTSWRAVHDWQVSGRPPDQRLAYIGYSFGIADGEITELRGWDHQPAHDFINTTLGVCFGGNYETAQPDPADLDALVWFIREARRRTGRHLPVDGHRDAPGAGTACPGRHLYAELGDIRARAEEGDMPTAEDIGHERFPPDPTVKRAYPGVRDDGYRWVTWDQYTYRWARTAADRAGEVLAGQAAVLAAVTGQDQTEAIRAVLAEHRAELVAELAEDLGPELAVHLRDVPADQVEAALAAVLRERDLRAAGAPG